MSKWFNKTLTGILLLASTARVAAAPEYESLRPHAYTTYDGLPTDNVQTVFQDSEGYMWFATRNGLARYDGFGMEVFKSNLRNGDLLTNNNISCLAEDSAHRLWIGTPDGLNVLHKETGELERIGRSEFANNPISCILPTRDGRILLGTNSGLYQYVPEGDSCIIYSREMSGDVMPQTSVKTLLEDSRGHIWIGTWNEGIYSLDPEGRFHSYPKINERGSAHVIFEDSRHRIWVGSWGCGLFMLRNPYDPSKASWVNYRHDPADPTSLSDNIIYSIGEDPKTNTLWIGTRSQVSLLPYGADSFIQYTGAPGQPPVRDVTSVTVDRQGTIWISMLGNGAMALPSSSSRLRQDILEPVSDVLGTNSVQAVIASKDGRLWISGGSHSGLLAYDPVTRSVSPNYGKLFRSPDGITYTIYCLSESNDGNILVGTYDGGLYVLSPDGTLLRHHTRENSPWLPGDRISTVEKDHTGRTWYGALPGLSFRYPDGSYCILNDILSRHIHVKSIVEGHDGGIWVGTQNLGVLRIDGTGTDPSAYSIHRYSPDDNNMNSAIITTLFCDPFGRIWAGTDGAGLSLYDYRTDRFIPVHIKWNLPGDMISSILGDRDGNLWIGSNVGLLNLRVPVDTLDVSYRLYTTGDGAQDNIFNANAAFTDSAGHMIFGGPHGLNIVDGVPSEIHEALLPVTITDIQVFGTSWSRLDPEERRAVSAKAPGYTDRITLEHSQNNFSIEFAVLDFANHPLQHKYAYRLDGFDHDWQTTDMSRRFAYYNNLPPGRYTFRVRATDAAGEWNSEERTVEVVIKPPLWATWWAKTIYCLLALALMVFIVLYYRRRVRRDNALHLRELEVAQAEQLNRTKLRFFTNITHEWLTPLSIITAVSEELKDSTPEKREYHRIMTNSVNRLTHLLQEVLEFRKAESGNLRLKVSEGDLTALVNDITDNLMPVMKGKNISCTVDAEEIRAWFDPDKIDKILYNLLSNASKYILPGCHVDVGLHLDAESGMAVITVSDNGPGIDSSRVPDLFKRFYEGEHRKFNTSGNGIGLSLTKDLVELHHGTIEVSTGEGKGTCFTVRIPVSRDAYAENEIDSLPGVTDLEHPADEDTPEVLPDDDTDTGEKATILVIEDDNDLLTLMARLLRQSYNVLTATDVDQAKELLNKNDVSLIISDIMMPGTSGVEFCRWAKAHIEWCHIPILLLTANTLEEAEVDAYDAGADGFMPKPFSLNVLLARISNLLRMRRNANRSFREQFVTDVPSGDYSSLDEDFLKKCVDCITAHIEDPDYSQTMFVAEMGISKSTLFRKLKSLTGLSYSSFARNIRLKTACRIMQEKRGIRISELAYAVGFNDPKYFSLCFKKEFGMLPSEYLEQYLNSEKNTTTPDSDEE